MYPGISNTTGDDAALCSINTGFNHSFEKLLACLDKSFCIKVFFLPMNRTWFKHQFRSCESTSNIGVFAGSIKISGNLSGSPHVNSTLRLFRSSLDVRSTSVRLSMNVPYCILKLPLVFYELFQLIHFIAGDKEFVPNQFYNHI